MSTAPSHKLLTKDASTVQPSRVAIEKVEQLSSQGVSLVNQGKLDEGIDCLRRAASLSPGIASIHHNLGAALGKRGRLEEAIASLEEAVRLQPDHAESYGNLALAYGQKGQRDDAVRTYREHTAPRPG